MTGAYAGVRPLISTGDPKKSVDISRKAELYETSSGLVTITGGKLTTWRRMAKLAVDRVVLRDGREAPCRTHEIPLGMPIEPSELAAADGLGSEELTHLAARYGYAARELLAMVEADPSLGERIEPDLPDIAAEAAFSVRNEQSRTLADVLLRRTRLGLLAARTLAAPGSEGAERAARAMARRAGLGRRAGGRRAGGAGARWPRPRGRCPPGEADGDRQRHARTRSRTPATTTRASWPSGAARWPPPGAAVIDVGGESGRTDREAVPEAVEAARVVPVIERLAADGLTVSVDTWRAHVARAGLEAGAHMVNDPSGLHEPEVADACAEHGAALVLTHTRVPPKQKGYPGLRRRGRRRPAAARRARRPGARARGGGREASCSTRASTWARPRPSPSSCCAACTSCSDLERPVLVAISRKDFIGALLGRAPAARDAGTLAALEASATGGAAYARVHDVAAAADYLTVRAAMRGELPVAGDLQLAEDLRREPAVGP